MKCRSNFLIAGSLRKRQTSRERILWDLLRKDQCGFRFRRQHPLAGYVLDFYCHSAMVAIEVDGPYHDEMRDRERDEVLAKLGIVTIRVSIDELDAMTGTGAEMIVRRVVEVCVVRCSEVRC